MEINPKVAVCGTQATAIDSHGKKINEITVCTENDDIKINMLFNNSFIHPSVFFRSDIIKNYRYDINYQYAEDYFLLAEICKKYTVANLSESLLLYRIGDSSITSTKKEQMIVSRNKVYKYQLNNLFNYKVDDSFIEKFIHLPDYKVFSFKAFKSVLEAIYFANKKNKIYSEDALRELLHYKWFNLLREKGTTNLLFHFFTSPLFYKKTFKLKQFRKLIKQEFFKLFGKKYQLL
jgi:hypothetical protein